MRYQLTFWLCLTVIIGYCFPVSAQEATQPAKSAATAEKKKSLEILIRSPKIAKVTKGFLNFIRKKETSIAKYSLPNWINLSYA